MSSNRLLSSLDEALSAVMAEIAAGVRARVAEMTGLEGLRERSDGDTTHSFDRFAEDLILRVLEASGLPMLVRTEESSPIEFGNDPGLVAIVDPVDGSDLVKRGYTLASSAIAIADLDTGEVLLSRVADIFADVQFAARSGVASRGGKQIWPSTISRASDAFVVCHGPTSGRRQMPGYSAMVRSRVGFLFSYAGPLDLAKVGSGQCDAVVEVSKGLHQRDVIPGLHIALTAGAWVSGPDGAPFSWDATVDHRCRFVLASTQELGEELCATTSSPPAA